MLDFLAVNYLQYKKEYDLILKVLGNDKKRSIEFIENYIDKREKHIELFIKSLCKSWVGFWDYIYLKSNFKAEKTKHYLEIIIKYADIEDIIFFKNSSNIATYIMQQPDFLSLIEEHKYNNKIKEIIKNLNITFESLEIPKDETKDLFDYVYDNNNYQINIDNINLMLTTKCDDKSLEKIKEANYTTILHSDCEPLIKYVTQSINEYVKNVLLKIPENVSESEDVIVELLNCEDLKDSLKFDIIKKQSAIINNLAQIDSIEVQEELFANNKVLPNWENIFVYNEAFETAELNEILITFLNKESNYAQLANNKIKENGKRLEDFIKDFSAKLIKCNELSYDSYKELLKSTTYTWSNINVENLNYEKVEWLVINKYLSISIDNYKRMKEHFSNLHITLIEKNQISFLMKFEDYSLDTSDILKLLNSNELTPKNKVSLIEKIDDNLIIQDKEIGKAVCLLLSNSEFIPLEFNVLESLLKHSNSIENRVKLLNKHADKISNVQIQSLVEILGHYYQEIFKKQHKPKFANNSFHAELFKILSKKNLIKRYEVDPKDKTLLKVIANY